MPIHDILSTNQESTVCKLINLPAEANSNLLQPVTRAILKKILSPYKPRREVEFSAA